MDGMGIRETFGRVPDGESRFQGGPHALQVPMPRGRGGEAIYFLAGPPITEGRRADLLVLGAGAGRLVLLLAGGGDGTADGDGDPCTGA